MDLNLDELINPDGVPPEDDPIVFSDVALEQIQNLDEEEQDKLSKGIALVYGRSLKLLVDANCSSYLAFKSWLTISSLSNQTTMFSINEYAFRVDICPETFCWYVRSIGLPGALRNYEIKRIL